MSKVAAIIVAYGKPESLLHTIKSIEAQRVACESIYVIDNTPDTSVQAALALLDQPHVVSAWFPENLGAEGGFCEGIRRAHPGVDFLWLFDDDSYVEPDALKELLAEYAILSRVNTIGALRCARPWDQAEDDRNVREIMDLFAWKGSFICSAAVEKIGLPLAELFLYAGDSEYGLRMRKNGFKIFMVLSSRIHSVEYTDMQPLQLGPIKKRIYNSPVRVYYAFRNELYINIKYRVVHRILRLTALGLYSIGVSMLVRRPDLSRAVRLGLWDGMRGKLGKCEKYTPAPVSSLIG